MRANPDSGRLLKWIPSAPPAGLPLLEAQNDDHWTGMDAPPQRRTSLAGFRTVSLLTLASRILGFARDSAMAGVFGLGEILDAFTLAFRIPNLARSLFGEGALTTAFLPEFVATESKSGPDAARRLATAVASRLALLLTGLVIAAEFVLAALHRAADSEYQIRLIELLALMTPYLLLICLAALAGAMLQAQRRFIWPALVPVLLNLWWLAAVAATAMLVVDPERRIRWIAASLLVGGLLQLLLPAAVLRRSGWGMLAADDDARAQSRSVFRAMLPTIVAASISQFNTVLDSLLAWAFASPAAARWTGGQQLVEPGTAAALYFAQRLYQFPLGLIGVAVGTVLYPTLAAHAASRDFSKLKDDLTHGLAVALSVALPASGGLVVLASPVTTVLFQHGRFTADDGLLTARIMAIYGSVAWAAIALFLIQRGFFAVGDRQTPLRTGLTAVAFNLVLTPLGAWLGGGQGLAAATALTTLFHLVISFRLLQRHQISIDWGRLRGRAARSLLATAAMMAICAILLLLMRTASPALRLGVALPAGIVIYLAVARATRLSEPFELLRPRRPGMQSVEGTA
ncbi:Lipid II flippase MurJ [Caulifigura coniformis]|uniref:Probable lipid II flippase MurJ n=1 Tax=Caulifigura coniformis TaxID=2527983 RepID=A0A517SF15_9PLAN|nr:murein biosynthesis integral membrane protein MurJ [Caulifigura coniformis]QDT54723.1 Lipid II flippase MurJ [Caulifigura coniformis]